MHFSENYSPAPHSGKKEAQKQEYGNHKVIISQAETVSGYFQPILVKEAEKEKQDETYNQPGNYFCRSKDSAKPFMLTHRDPLHETVLKDLCRGFPVVLP